MGGAKKFRPFFFCCGEKKITPINQSTIKKSATCRLQKIKAKFIYRDIINNLKMIPTR